MVITGPRFWLGCSIRDGGGGPIACIGSGLVFSASVVAVGGHNL